MEKLRKGGSPTITKGESIGDTIALDHVLPCSIVPELAARYYNLEALSSKKIFSKVQRSLNGKSILPDGGNETTSFHNMD
jgi:hypothetical protein